MLIPSYIMKIKKQIVKLNELIQIKYMKSITRIFKRIKGRKISYLIVILISIVLLIWTSLFLLNCMIEYKYNIDENFDQALLYDTYSSRISELETVMWYLKGGILYLLFMIFFFIYQSKKK